MDVGLVGALDDASLRAVPPAQTRAIDGWLARRTPQLETKRVNSVLARHGDRGELDRRLADCERFYREAGLPSRFQLTPACRPAGLRDVLLGRGYTVEEPTSVQTCAIARGPIAGCRPGMRIAVTSRPTEAWWRTWQLAVSRTPDQLRPVADLFSRIVERCAFVIAARDEQCMAVGMGVLDGRWVGIFNMAANPAYRRQGGASAVLDALLTWARQHGADNAYLQVGLNNTPALELYQRSGFREAYRYEYLTQPLEV